MNTNSFQRRHIGPDENEQKQMLDVIGIKSLDQLIKDTHLIKQKLLKEDWKPC